MTHPLLPLSTRTAAAAAIQERKDRGQQRQKVGLGDVGEVEVQGLELRGEGPAGEGRRAEGEDAGDAVLLGERGRVLWA